ncbi:MAG TPA: chromosome segregation protein SMC [Pseudomonadales bacterium]|nr:chromosome segregation protein SMC [Pseudomonadales bacterium]
MRLKQIKLAGFKSFVDPTTVSFPGNRTAIVGPNGCGKSNIIDAVRWVMGESSARQLRGEALTDVIFNGSTSRKPTALASIELTFDNSDGRIGGEYAQYSEIAIRRQVTRDAQSQYFLNGTKCRRRDIMDIFLGTGFGPRSYSIIEQGMISQIVDAKPEELRIYLEEAAGISKYKERRRETENRIRHTEENLDRLNDVREELGRQIEHLQRQARAAERYRELKEEERKVTAELHALRLIAIEATLQAREAEIRQLEIALERAVAEQRSVDTEIEKSRVQHTEHSDEFNRVQGRFYQLGADIARIEEAIAYNQQRVKQLELDLDSVAQRRSETERQLAMDEDQIRNLRSALAEAGPRVDAARAEDERSTAALEAAEAQLREWQSSWESFNERAAANQRESDVEASRIEHLEQVLQRLRARAAQLDDESRNLVAGDVTDDIGELAAGIESESAALKAAELDMEHCLAELGASREDLVIREQVLEEARTDVQALRHELASLEAVQRAALGRTEGAADDWLRAQRLTDAPRIGEGLSVTAGWERAVETVLGDRLQAVRVDAVAAYAQQLAKLEHGVVTLVDGGLANGTERDLPTLASFVRSSVPLGSLLNGVYTAQNLAAALAHRANLAPGESIIARDGTWLGPDWLRLDRGEDIGHGIIERGQQLEVLRERVEQAELNLTELQGRVADGRGRVETLDRRRHDLHGTINGLSQSLGQLRADHGVHRVRLEEADARRERLRRDAADIEQQVVHESTRLNAARERLAQAEQARERFDADRTTLSAARETNMQAVEQARQQSRSDRDRFHALNAEKQNLTSRLEATETARQRLLRQQQELAGRHDELTAGVESSQAPLPTMRTELEGKLAERLAVEHKLADVRRALETAEAQVRELEGKRGQHAEAVEAVRATLETARVDRQGLTVKRGSLLEQLEATGLALDAVRPTLPNDATEAAWTEQLERIAARIQRLGPINLAAIEEFTAASERKQYLDQQHADLTEALETLGNAIRRIDRETRARFKETFDAVNKGLGELFTKVFGGGHAYLELTGEDLLDTGVTLMARPPGKRNASIHLLSGGEKAMTAVALIFSIFHLNPSPVCLLDEVDAPLDDSNVVRFASLIREMSEGVQFLVITHNKLTMEMADQLMGVTMNEPGVSRLVSVDVEEAAEMAAV